MKYLVSFGILCLLFCAVNAQTTSAIHDTTLLQPVEVNAIRANDKTPVAKTTLSRPDIEKNNTGQDLPFILNQTPSVVVNSDAGNGIGYTGIRIRGIDAARVNVTINSIPYNDAESQGTFFVDLPDIASSAANIQVQRGVGTSSNGGSAFGASINVATNDIITKKGLEFSSNAGSYNSFRNTLLLNSGLLAKHFTIDARLSDIRSDGYVDRAGTRLRSFFTSTAYTDSKNSLRVNIFSGKEKTYQAWYGIDEKTLATNRRYNLAGTDKEGDPYDNETDNYTQTHYQLFYNRKFNKHWKGNIAFFLTRGKGYYEQYKAGESLLYYGLPLFISGVDTVENTDLVRRLWLDNYFYGTVFSAQYEKNKTGLIIGGNANKYDGKHFGEIVRATEQRAVPANFRWYNLTANKKELSGFIKWTQQLTANLQSFIDLQVRSVEYNLYGFRNNPSLTVKNNYFFVTPKAGFTFTIKKEQFYISYARAAKEPNREDFETGKTQAPTPEFLDDFEAGYEHRSAAFNCGIGLYFMNYKDQLVLTGKINDVGAYTRTNISKSYRAGIELQAVGKFNKFLSVNGNISFSKNKLKNFSEFLDDYDNGGQKVNLYNKTNLAFSPAIVASASINIIPLKNGEISLISKYVSSQYLDNTSNKSRTLSSYYLQDARVGYELSLRGIKAIKVFVQANNLFSRKYEPNGYSFSYITGGAVTTENYYFPMAPFNVVAGFTIKL
ncbi:MAG: TonB-dependent receptor plug domain-containing protein [Ferruginibacter sp.]|nr:TonB-dependent receptor plug domain-containing protein [Ferruginibacter sp.]